MHRLIVLALLAACTSLLASRPSPAVADGTRVLRVVAPVEIGGLELSRAGAVFARMDGTEAPEERVALRRRASAILAEALPVIPVAWSELGVAIGRRVARVTVDSFETSYRLHEITWAER